MHDTVYKIRKYTWGIEYSIYTVSVVVLYVCYALVYFQIYEIDSKYLEYLRTFVHIFVCGFLIIRFNPFVQFKITARDSDIIFGSALLLLSNVILADITLNNAIDIAHNYYISK
jgi:hypothetical protein